jgi:hypothetical protein
MPRTRDELQRAAADAEAWLDSLDPATSTAENPADLRRIGLALRALATDQAELDEAVREARRNGRSWAQIGMMLGISRQSARERYSQPVTH